METRSTIKRKAVDNLEQNHIFKITSQHDNSQLGSRDIVNEEPTSVKAEIRNIKQENTENIEGSEFDFFQSEIKIEHVEQKVVVVSFEKSTFCDEYNIDGAHLSNLTKGEEDVGVVSQSGNFEQGLYLVIDCLESPDILLCRLISKQWRSIVDHFLDSKLAEKPFDNEVYMKHMQQSQGEIKPNKKYAALRYNFRFATNSYCNNYGIFTKRMADHLKSGFSPFVGGANIIISNIMNRNDEQNIFFEMFGKHIHSLEIRHTRLRSKVEIQDFTESVMKYRYYTPNLKSLRIYAGWFHRYSTPKCDAGKLSKIKKPKGAHLPKNLKSIVLDLCNGRFVPLIQKIIFDQLIEPHCKELLQNISLEYTSDFNLTANQLKELTLLIRPKGPSPFVKTLSPVNWSSNTVQKLYLRAELYKKNEMNDLLILLERFPSVQYLKLDYKIWSHIIFKEFTTNHFTNKIHTLELLRFESKPSDVPYKFLLAFPHLRYFTLFSTCFNFDVNSPKSISTYFVTDKMFGKDFSLIYDTKLWKVAANLQKAVIHVNHLTIKEENKQYIATRELYERHCGNRIG